MSLDQIPEISSPDIGRSGEIIFAKRGCCFWIPFLGPDQSAAERFMWWERISKAESKEERWWCIGWKKLREWSEIVAGPKWKTFIRRFKQQNRPAMAGRVKFHYDPLSYALNFDEGQGQNGHLDEDYLRRDFSSRYASIPASAKSSMDLGREGVTFT